MCKDNTIITSWSWVGPYILGLCVVGGYIATLLGAKLTWGSVMLFPAVLTLFLNKKCHFRFVDSELTVNWLFFKHVIPFESIKCINVLDTRLGTWIVVELNDAPDLTLSPDCTKILIYCLMYYRKSYLIPLQWGERDQALDLLKRNCPLVSVIVS